MIETLRRAQDGDQTVRTSVKRKDQIGVVAELLNDFLSVNERLRTEIDRQQSENVRYNEKMASIGEVAAAVAHEIKNPLAGISGALQVLAEDFPDDSPRKEIAGEVLNEIERLDRVVRDLLIYARPPELHLILTDINAIIDKLTDNVKESARKQNVTVKITREEVPVILADTDQMEKAFKNVVDNSLHSMTEGGTLTIATQQYGTHEISVTISDTGREIISDDPLDIFKPRISSRYSGTWLGLAISRSIIENHNGRIEVESELGKGSRFRIILPVKR